MVLAATTCPLSKEINHQLFRNPPFNIIQMTAIDGFLAASGLQIN